MGKGDHELSSSSSSWAPRPAVAPLPAGAEAVVRGRAAADGSSVAVHAASCAKGAALDADGVSGTNSELAAAVEDNAIGDGEPGGGAEHVMAFLIGEGMKLFAIGRGCDRPRGACALSGVTRGVSATFLGSDTKSAAKIWVFHSPPSPPVSNPLAAATPAPNGGGDGGGDSDWVRFCTAVSSRSTVKFRAEAAVVDVETPIKRDRSPFWNGT